VPVVTQTGTKFVQKIIIQRINCIEFVTFGVKICTIKYLLYKFKLMKVDKILTLIFLIKGLMEAHNLFEVVQIMEFDSLF